MILGFLAAGLSTATSNPRILILGDSLSAAYNMPTEQGWVAQLAERLGPNATVVNAAITGDTTASARARLPQALERHQPNLVIIALGGNDGLRGVSLTAFEQNLTAMITTVRQTGANVVLAGVRLPSNYGNAFIQRFLDVYARVAHETDVTFIPRLLEGVADHPELMQDDGIHPSAHAQPIILNTVWTAIEPLLNESASR